ncbi:hypothetical protein CEXT_645331 [Caerostris extrusa]|uniref:Uncharacterized protein n=1 Tax=Caerostris extrusa TaxID=172846 RepID=A0AAV4UQN3_CAEEX|nr:hypothetical protein CEXT_645331 [Caerostris extrusa]
MFNLVQQHFWYQLSFVDHKKSKRKGKHGDWMGCWEGDNIIKKSVGKRQQKRKWRKKKGRATSILEVQVIG